MLLLTDPTDDDRPIPVDVLLLGKSTGQVGLQSYKYYSDEDIQSMIDNLEYCVDYDRVSIKYKNTPSIFVLYIYYKSN